MNLVTFTYMYVLAEWQNSSNIPYSHINSGCLHNIRSGKNKTKQKNNSKNFWLVCGLLELYKSVKIARYFCVKIARYFYIIFIDE